MGPKRQRLELDLRGEDAPAAKPGQLTLNAKKPGSEAIDPGTAMTKPRTSYAGQGIGNRYLARGSHRCFSCAFSLTRLCAASLTNDLSYAPTDRYSRKRAGRITGENAAGARVDTDGVRVLPT